MEVFNMLTGALDERPDLPEGHRFRSAPIGNRVGARLSGLSVYELPPGQALWAYHYELMREEWLVVVAGEPTVRTPAGERRLKAGDVVCFPIGPDGAHAVRNDTADAVRVAMPSTRPANGYVAVQPESGKVVINDGAGFRRVLSLDAEVDYWEGEA